MNEQDPLAQLRDIHVPEPLGWWPPAPGWWLLALLLLAGIGLAVFWFLRQRRGNAYRQLARAEVRNAWETLELDGDAPRYAQKLSQVLHRAALVAYPREDIKGLHGQAWLTFLDKSGGTGDEFAAGPGRQLLSLPYRPGGSEAENDLRPLHELALRWLECHRKLKHPPGERAGGPDRSRDQGKLESGGTRDAAV